MCPLVALLLTSFPTTSHSQVTLTQLEGWLNTDEEKLYVLLDRAEYKYTNLAYSALNELMEQGDGQAEAAPACSVRLDAA